MQANPAQHETIQSSSRWDITDHVCKRDGAIGGAAALSAVCLLILHGTSLCSSYADAVGVAQVVHE